ncbi:hypothetical protein D3C85_1023210 [compost metagenome]
MTQQVKVFNDRGSLVYTETVVEGGSVFIRGDIIFFSGTVYKHDTYKMYKLDGGHYATFTYPVSVE